MDSKIQTAKRIIKEEGIFSLFKKGFKHYIFPFLYYLFCFLYFPFIFFKVKRFKSKDTDQLLDLVLLNNFSYIAPIQVRSEIASLLEVVKRN